MFASIIHEASYRKVQHFLYERLPESKDLHHVDGRTAFMLIWGSAVVVVEVGAMDATEAVVTVRSEVVTGCSQDHGLLQELLVANASQSLASFALGAPGVILLQHAMLGSTLNREELWRSLEAIGSIADRMDDALIAKYGGETSVARLAKTGPAVTERPELRGWLEARGVKVTDAGSAGNAPLDALAARLGRDQHLLEPLLAGIRYGLRSHGRFTVSLKNAPPEQINAVTNVARLLQQNTLLARSRYSKEEKLLFGAVAQDNAAIRQFFDGGWLEGYARVATQTELHRCRRQGEDVEVLGNVKGRLHTFDLEFDVIARLGDRVVWVECKTGGYAESVGKYSKIGGALKIPSAARLLVLSSITPEVAANLKAIHGITAVAPSGLPEAIRAAVQGQAAVGH